MPDFESSTIIKKSFGSAGVRKEKVVPDYTGDRYHAGVLVERLKNYWRRLGYHNIEFWIETDVSSSGVKTYSIRSNIVYNCADLSKVLR